VVILPSGQQSAGRFGFALFPCAYVSVTSCRSLLCLSLLLLWLLSLLCLKILIIGASFFLNLNFEVKLPELLFHASIEEETLTELRAQFLDFLRYQCPNVLW